MGENVPETGSYKDAELTPTTRTSPLANSVADVTPNPSGMLPVAVNLPVAGSVPGYELNGWYGMLAPPGMPRAIVQRLNEELTRIVGEPVMRERLLGVGAEPAPEKGPAPRPEAPAPRPAAPARPAARGGYVARNPPYPGGCDFPMFGGFGGFNFGNGFTLPER